MNQFTRNDLTIDWKQCHELHQRQRHMSKKVVAEREFDALINVRWISNCVLFYTSSEQLYVPFFHIIDEKLLIKNRPGECKYLRLAKYWNALVCSDLFASYAILLAAQAVAKHNKCSIAWHRINEAQCSCCCSNTSLSLALSLSFSRIPTVCYLEKKRPNEWKPTTQIELVRSVVYTKCNEEKSIVNSQTVQCIKNRFNIHCKFLSLANFQITKYE